MKNARTLWTQGSRAPVTVEVDEISARADKFLRRTARKNMSEYLGTVVVVVVFLLYAAIPERLFDGGMPPLMRFASGLIACGAVFVATYLWLRSKAPEGESDQTTLTAYRALLERRRDLLRAVPRWYIAPFLPGLALFLLGGAISRWGQPSLWLDILTAILCAAVLGTIVVFNKRAAMKLSQELAELPQAPVDGGP